MQLWLNRKEWKMKKGTGKKPGVAPLRRRAEDRLKKEKPETGPATAEMDQKKLIHELQVHQIELEMQNEELHHAREEVEEILAKYTDLYNFAPVGYLTFDEKGLILELNLTAGQLLGIERIFLFNKPFSSYIQRGFQDRFYLHLQEVLESSVKETCELVLKKNDGVTFDAQLESVVVKVDGRKVVRTALTDITEHKRAEEAVKHERDLLQTIMNSARKSHLAYVDRDFNFMRVNEAYAVNLGYQPEELIGKNHFALHPNTENEMIFTRVRDTGKEFEIHDKPFEFPDQPERGVTYWDWTLKAVKDPGGQVIGLVLSAYETTDRKTNEERIEGLVLALQKAHDELEKRVAERTAQLVESNKSLQQAINKRIASEEGLRESQERLRNLTKHLHKVREQERAFLSRELHDEFGQVLTGMKMDVRWIEKRLPEESTLILERLNSIITLIDNAILSVQTIAMELRPPSLDDFGISEEIKLILLNLEKKTHITYRFISTPQKIVLNRDISIEVFRIFQEALTNITRHADAKNVTILLQHTGDKLIMEIRDDGRGITKEELINHTSIGLTGMRERAYAVEGSLTIVGIRRKGTIVTLKVPLNEGKNINTKTKKRGLKRATQEA